MSVSFAMEQAEVKHARHRKRSVKASRARDGGRSPAAALAARRLERLEAQDTRTEIEKVRQSAATEIDAIAGTPSPPPRPPAARA